MFPIIVNFNHSHLKPILNPDICFGQFDLGSLHATRCMGVMPDITRTVSPETVRYALQVLSAICLCGVNVLLYFSYDSALCQIGEAYSSWELTTEVTNLLLFAAGPATFGIRRDSAEAVLAALSPAAATCWPNPNMRLSSSPRYLTLSQRGICIPSYLNMGFWYPRLVVSITAADFLHEIERPCVCIQSATICRASLVALSRSHVVCPVTTTATSSAKHTVFVPCGSFRRKRLS